MVQVWMLADPCADPGIFARGVQGRLPENSSDNVFFFFFCPQLLLFYSVLLMVYFKENYNFTRCRGGEGCPTFSRRAQPFPGVKLFPGGGGGGGSKC